jgi:hypothetical protein
MKQLGDVAAAQSNPIKLNQTESNLRGKYLSHMELHGSEMGGQNKAKG